MDNDKLPPALEADMKALQTLPDDQIDTSDIPETKPSFWRDATRPNLQRPWTQA